MLAVAIATPLLSCADGCAPVASAAWPFAGSSAPDPAPRGGAPRAPGDDLCKGLVRDKLPHPMAVAPKPAKGVPYVDPAFGAKVTRITDVKAETGRAGVRAPMYSTVPAWNADESYLILLQTEGYSGSGLPSQHLLFDGRTYRFIRQLDIRPADVEHVYWSATDPDVLYYVTDYGVPAHDYDPVLVRYHVRADRHEVLHHFGSAKVNQKLDFGHVLYMSWDNDLVGVRVIEAGDTIRAQSYRISTATESGWRSYPSGRDYHGLHVAPSGKAAIIGSKVIDPVTQAMLRPMRYDTGEHGALAMLPNGQDVWATVQFDTRPNGTLVTENLQTGETRTIIGPANGYPYPPKSTHISASAFKAKGWVAVSVEGNHAGERLLDQEILLANVDTGEVCRLAHHHSQSRVGPQHYWAEPHVVISPTGTRALFGSDWGGTDSVDAYVVETPSYRP
jgi:hypothetical protein